MKETQVCKCGRHTFRYGVEDSGKELKCPDCERVYEVYTETGDDGLTETSLEIISDYLTE